MDDRPNYGGVYARGYNDGLRAAGIENPYEFPFIREPPMNAKKLESKLRGLSIMERKVYDAIPIQAQWGVPQIIAELARSGSRPDHTQVLRVCRELCSNGLATEYAGGNKNSGRFTRITADLKTKLQEEIVMAEPAQKPTSAEVVLIKTAPKRKGPMELLAELASKARQFAEELDTAALEIEQEFQTSEAKSEKLKQLQALLKGIAD